MGHFLGGSVGHGSQAVTHCLLCAQCTRSLVFNQNCKFLTYIFLTLQVLETPYIVDSSVVAIVVPYELYEVYDWEKVPELYGTLRILCSVGQYVGIV